MFIGESFGADTERAGEIVFNTSMTGYQEILTDPSYKGQIIVMTEPHIGNVGMNPEDIESGKVHAEGLVVRECSPVVSNWRAKTSIQEFLRERNVPAIAKIDTRALTKHIRDVGAMRAILSTRELSPARLLAKVKLCKSMSGLDLAKDVTCKKGYVWSEPEWKWETLNTVPPRAKLKRKIVVMDFGVKQNILRCLTDRGCEVQVVPARASSKEIFALRPDGILLSNGPGDPAAVTYAVETIREMIDEVGRPSKRVPIFGICLGHQLLGLALGGRTFKLKFGHRGANHPVKDLGTGKIEITSQNHGFCVDIDSLAGKDVELTHINLNDNTLEGMSHKELPVFSVQYHPESSAGPRDSRYLFDRFIRLADKYRG